MMGKKEVKNQKSDKNPMLKTAKEMSKLCGIGENKLRELIEQGELEYLPIGNRKLLCDEAIWDYYSRKKVAVANFSPKKTQNTA